ncbi:5-formyltetrahydrofolate cyclo-ligase [Phycisphaerales bacterium]|nr:5-formyltetrahydrofolate cyclo-ligase [Phycisphaerales bacterium]
MESLRQAKAALRERMRGVIRAITPERWAAASSEVCAHILEMPEYRDARVVMMYHPTSREINLRGVAEACERTGRTVCMPRVIWATMELQPARMVKWGEGLTEPRNGIREPLPEAALLPASQIDLVVVPGVSFDPRGGRLGRGAGFYDRFLSTTRARKIGVCLDEQIVDDVPMGEGDVRLDVVVTPMREFRRGG